MELELESGYNYNLALQEAVPHTSSITAIHTDLSNFTAKIVTQENIVLQIEYRPAHSWEVLQIAPADQPNPLTSFESLHTLLGHFSRLYRQSFQAAVVAKLLEHTTAAAAAATETTTPPTPTTDTTPVVPTTATSTATATATATATRT